MSWVRTGNSLPFARSWIKNFSVRPMVGKASSSQGNYQLRDAYAHLAEPADNDRETA